MSLRRPIIVTGLLIGTLFVAGAASAARPDSATSIALGKSDVPAGYALQLQALSNAGMVAYSGLPKSQLDQHGRLTGLANTFTRGSYGIVSFVSQYKSAAGAQWEYAQSIKSDLHHGKQVSASKVGSRSTGFTQNASAKGARLVAFGVDFQKGDYDMTALVWGPPGKASIANAEHYAQIMAGRAH